MVCSCSAVQLVYLQMAMSFAYKLCCGSGMVAIACVGYLRAKLKKKNGREHGFLRHTHGECIFLGNVAY